MVCVLRREPGPGGDEAGAQSGGQPLGTAHRRPVPGRRVARLRLHQIRHLQVVSTDQQQLAVPLVHTRRDAAHDVTLRHVCKWRPLSVRVFTQNVEAASEVKTRTLFHFSHYMLHHAPLHAPCVNQS